MKDTTKLFKQKFVQVFITVIVAGISHIDLLIADQISFDTAKVMIKGHTFRMELAETARQRQQGLMFRKYLSKQSAMLFVYPKAGDHRIWMKNTLIPLMVIWLDDNETVIHTQRLEPCYVDPCPSYGSNDLSRYIIEFHAEFMDLKIGDRLPGIRRLAQH